MTSYIIRSRASAGYVYLSAWHPDGVYAWSSHPAEAAHFTRDDALDTATHLDAAIVANGHAAGQVEIIPRLGGTPLVRH